MLKPGSLENLPYQNSNAQPPSANAGGFFLPQLHYKTIAITMFLRQCLLTDSIPLKIKKPHYNQEVLEAIEEAEELAKDPNAPKYETVEELFAALEAE